MESFRRKYCEAMVVRSDLHKYLIGRKGVTAKSIRESTGVRIVFPERGDPNANVIQLTGTKEQIALGRKEVEKILSHYKDLQFAEMHVDPKHHHYFVRRGGEVCEAISKEFQNNIYICFPKGGAVNSSKVVLKGTREAIEGTTKRIASIVAGLSTLTTIEVIIPQKFHGHVIGSQGKVIQQLQTEYNVVINFPKKKTEPYPVTEVREDGVKPSDVIIVTGRAQHCEDVKKILLLRVPRSEAEWEAVEPVVTGGITRSMVNNYLSEPDLPSPDESTSVKRRRMEVNPEIEAAILKRMEEISQGKEPPLPRMSRQGTGWPARSPTQSNSFMTNAFNYGETSINSGPRTLLPTPDWVTRNDMSQNSTFNGITARSGPWNSLTDRPKSLMDTPKSLMDGYPTTFNNVAASDTWAAKPNSLMDGYPTTVNNVSAGYVWRNGIPDNFGGGYSTNSVTTGDTWPTLDEIPENFGGGYSTNATRSRSNTSTAVSRKRSNQGWKIPHNFGGGYSTGSSTNTDHMRPLLPPPTTLGNGSNLQPWWTGDSILGAPPTSSNVSNSNPRRPRQR